MFEGVVTTLPLAAPEISDFETRVNTRCHEKTWEIPSPLKCPVVGIGVSDDEGPRVLKKCGRKTLEHLVCRNDMGICPVSCNSHNACQSVKKLCAKHKKELRFLPSSSISALTCAIQTDTLKEG